MRDLNNYDIIFCDIDDTLIHGFWTDIMRVTWDIFRSNTLSDVLMHLQAKHNIYKVNQKLRHMLANTYRPIVFLTARKDHPATHKLIQEILAGQDNITIHSLATDNPHYDKMNAIIGYMQDDPTLQRICMFDDNKSVRDMVASLDIDVFDARDSLHEGLIG